jgi:hypothetical protein
MKHTSPQVLLFILELLGVMHYAKIILLATPTMTKAAFGTSMSCSLNHHLTVRAGDFP